MRITRNAERERRIQDRLTDQIAAAHERKLRASLNSAIREAADAYENQATIETAIANIDGRVKDALVKVWSGSIDVFTERTNGQINDATGKGWMRYNKKEFSALYKKILEQYTLVFGSRKITQISKTTRDEVRGIIQSSTEEGLTLYETSRAIIATGARNNLYRSHLIARTETHGSAQFASMETARESGVVTGKEWIATDDQRTRDDPAAFDHVSAGGQVVDLSAPFIVSGEELMHPGDPMGSPGNVIMCRCAMTYVV
jgi:hypothetical protein